MQAPHRACQEVSGQGGFWRSRSPSSRGRGKGCPEASSATPARPASSHVQTGRRSGRSRVPACGPAWDPRIRAARLQSVTADRKTATDRADDPDESHALRRRFASRSAVGPHPGSNLVGQEWRWIDAARSDV